MKRLAFAVIAAALLGSGVAPAFADSSTPIDLYILTGDPVFGHLAGLSDTQLVKIAHEPVAKQPL